MLITAIPMLPTGTLIMARITPATPTGAFEQPTRDIPDIGASVEHIGAAAGACAEPIGAVQFEQLIGAAVAGAFVAWPMRAAPAATGAVGDNRRPAGA